MALMAQIKIDRKRTKNKDFSDTQGLVHFLGCFWGCKATGKCTTEE